MAFDQGCGSRRQSRVLPGALDGKFLADRVRRGDALALAVTGSGDAAQHGVDVVTIAFGIGQTLQQEDRGSFAHDEAVGALGKGSCPGSRECADLAELDEGGNSHVAVNSAGDRDIEIMLHQSIHRCAQSCHRRGTCGVRGEVGTVEVVNVRNTAGEAVGQFAGHAVFGDFRKQFRDPFPQLTADIRLHGLGQLGERRAFVQLLRVLRKVHPHRGQIMFFPAHGISEDHRGAIGVQWPPWIPVVFQCFTGAGNCPLLHFIHRLGDTRRDRQAPFHRLPRKLAHPAADLGVGLIGRAMIGVIVECRVPTGG